MLRASYILPIKLASPADGELASYLRWLRTQLELIVVDGSRSDVFAANNAAWPGVQHLPPAGDIEGANGKVRGVLTGLRVASHDRVVIADADVRYGAGSLRQVLNALKRADVVRPQNYFHPLPWHAFWDTGRMLLNRATDGDWPGTLAVRRSVLAATEGYDGDSLFENLELVRTVRAAGGRELLAREIFVRRLPPPARHFLSQRVRQAYDEFARPARLALQLMLLPGSMALVLRRPRLLALPLLGSIALAEIGRRRQGGGAVFPIWTSLAAPLWLMERMLCAWLAAGSRLAFGGVRYHGRTIARAATSQRELAARYADAHTRAASAEPARPTPARSASEAPAAPTRPRAASKRVAKEEPGTKQTAVQEPATHVGTRAVAVKTPANARRVTAKAPGNRAAHPKQAAHPRGATSRARKSA